MSGLGSHQTTLPRKIQFVRLVRYWAKLSRRLHPIPPTPFPKVYVYVTQQVKEGGALLPGARKYGFLAVTAPQYLNSAVESPFPSSLGCSP